ncbi:thioredoxin family protein [bacterium]|nr:thioredoxin family protein [bacterium]
MSKKSIITILAIIILPLLAFWGLSWNKDATALADSNLPQIIKFSSSMCLECKEVEKIFNEIMPKYKDKVSYTAIVVDSRKDMNNKLIKKYNITLVPTVVMLDSNGKECKRFEGAAEKSEYIEVIESLK